jgi:filamentous hemagglutinin family protein
MPRFPPASPGVRRRRTSLLSSLVLLQALLAASQAQITLDGSLGPRGPLTGPNYRIDANAGQIRGSNLFHSFGQFNVRPGERATFTGPNTVANIVGRVTGGQASAIDGVLRSEIAGANLYLLNPSGVLFGPNAGLDVSGSFHVSTADFLRFTDGATFFADLGQESVLTVASPAAFGFLGQNSAAITIQGSTLRVPAGQDLSGGREDHDGGWPPRSRERPHRCLNSHPDNRCRRDPGVCRAGQSRHRGQHRRQCQQVNVNESGADQ